MMFRLRFSLDAELLLRVSWSVFSVRVSNFAIDVVVRDLVVD